MADRLQGIHLQIERKWRRGDETPRSSRSFAKWVFATVGVVTILGLTGNREEAA